jgi:hypothetical protein
MVYHKQPMVYKTTSNRVTEWHEIKGGQQTTESLNLDQNLLNKIGKIVLQHENQNQVTINTPSIAYGSPLPYYGAPSYIPSRVVGIRFTGPWQSQLVGQYWGQSQQQINNGWRQPSTSYDVSLVQYGVPRW